MPLSLKIASRASRALCLGIPALFAGAQTTSTAKLNGSGLTDGLSAGFFSPSFSGEPNSELRPGDSPGEFHPEALAEPYVINVLETSFLQCQ